MVLVSGDGGMCSCERLWAEESFFVQDRWETWNEMIMFTTIRRSDICKTCSKGSKKSKGGSQELKKSPKKPDEKWGETNE